MKDFLVLDQDIAVYIGPSGTNWDAGDQDWFYINDGYWIVQAGTIWDGATAVWDGGEHPNKPGFPLLWCSSLIHDLGYVFMLEDGFPYTKKEIDKIFMRLMEAEGFKFSLIYYYGVRIFGGIWNTLADCYRNSFNKERQLPAHLGEYEIIDISRYSGVSPGGIEINQKSNSGSNS
jgi:hypothetical protein